MSKIRVYSSVRNDFISICLHNHLLYQRELNADVLCEKLSNKGKCLVLYVKEDQNNKQGVETTLKDGTKIFGNFLLIGKRDCMDYRTSLEIDIDTLI